MASFLTEAQRATLAAALAAKQQAGTLPWEHTLVLWLLWLSFGGTLPLPAAGAVLLLLDLACGTQLGR